MKLFQRLLLAPAALGLMAPIAVNADNAFSSTTSLSGSAVFTVGSVSDGGTANNQEEFYMQYAYGLDLNTSFNGKDLFYAGIEAGNSAGPLSDLDSATTTTNQALNIHSLFYSFPIGGLSVTAGPLLDQDDVVGATISAYSEAFRLGSMPFSLDGDLTGPGLAIEYSGDSGFVASASYVSLDGADSSKGLNSDDGNDVATITLGYNGEGFGGGLVVAAHDGNNYTVDYGYSTFGGGIYYSPEAIPATISVAYDTKDPNGSLAKDSSDLFVGLEYAVGPGTLNAAWNSNEVDDNSKLTDSTGFEVSYSYPVNDHLTITPGFFSVEETTTEDTDSGVVIETAFSF